MEEPDFDVIHALVRLLSAFFFPNKYVLIHRVVLYDLVSSHIFGQQEGHWLCLESHGLCRKVSSRGMLFQLK